MNDLRRIHRVLAVRERIHHVRMRDLAEAHDLLARSRGEADALRSRIEDAAGRLSTPDDLSIDELELRASEVRTLVDARIRAEHQAREHAARAEAREQEAHLAARDVRTMEHVRDRVRSRRDRAVARVEQQTAEESVLSARARGKCR
jgi:hypothetical protein